MHLDTEQRCRSIINGGEEMTLDIRVPSMAIIDTKEQWNRAVNDFAVQDVYYTYEYNEWNAKKEQGQAKLVHFQNNLGSVIYPFIIRKIDAVVAGSPLYDITSAYGYGGPLISGDPGVLKEFRELFQAYCQNANIVSEIVRMHPLLENAHYLQGYCTLQYIRKTTAVNLAGELSAIRQHYSHMAKRNIKKARSHQLYCRAVEKSDKNIGVFLKLYNETMQRKSAARYYYFSEAQIEQQLADTAISKSHLLFVFHEAQVIAAAIVLTANRFAHYHLGASDTRYLSMRPNNLLFDFMVAFSKDKGCQTLHLGGGYQEGDSLFKYKSSFTNQNYYDYYLGTNIYQHDIYKKLAELKGKANEVGGFFPIYRKP